jgi:hypothetical protein
MAERSNCYGQKSAKQDEINSSCFPGYYWLAYICPRFDGSSINLEAYAAVGRQGPAPSPSSEKFEA